MIAAVFHSPVKRCPHRRECNHASCAPPAHLVDNDPGSSMKLRITLHTAQRGHEPERIQRHVQLQLGVLCDLVDWVTVDLYPKGGETARDVEAVAANNKIAINNISDKVASKSTRFECLIRAKTSDDSVLTVSMINADPEVAAADASARLRRQIQRSVTNRRAPRAVVLR